MVDCGYGAGLGALYSLPFELRTYIWRNLALQPAQARFEAIPWKLQFLQASRQIYEEASPIAYQQIILRVFITPKYVYQSWLSVAWNGASRPPLQDLTDAMDRGFGMIPFEKLKKIHLVIEAPDPGDPGQIVYLFKKCVDLLTLLECAKLGLPSLKISLRNSASAKWSLEGKPQKSIAADPKRYWPPRNGILDCPAEQSIVWNDIEIVLYPFSRLRNVTLGKIHAPKVKHYRRNFVDDMVNAMMKDDPVGTYQNPDALLDAMNEDILDEIFVDLDIRLDELRGATADLLRVARFSSWYSDRLGSQSSYEGLYEKFFRTQGRSTRLWRVALGRLQWRYALLRATNPKNASQFYHRDTSRDRPSLMVGNESYGLNCTEKPADVNLVRDKPDCGRLISDQWDRDAWHTYVRALQPFSCEFYADICLKGDKLHHLADSIREFADKLESWGIDTSKVEEARFTTMYDMPWEWDEFGSMDSTN